MTHREVTRRLEVQYN